METNIEIKKKVSFHTLGCRLNFSESGSIAQGFVDRGYDVVEFGEASDVVFLNTCTVTDGADSSCRNLIRKAQASSPEAKIVVAGCYAQMEAEKIKEMKGVDLILGTSEKYKVFDYLEAENDLQIKIDKSADFFGAATTTADSHTRAFLKIQDGCNYVCSFCIIPFARGRSKAIQITEAKKEALKLAKSGFKEIVLTGVNIGEYESSSGEKLVDLVKTIADIPEVQRIRLGSVEPNTITKELLETLKDTGKYQDHFHIPLQSASNEILKSMRRKYLIEDYKEILQMVRSYFPLSAFGADLIVGYPGETEDLFLETFNFLRTGPITHFHVFPYSKRKGTTASKLSDQIQSAVKKERVKTLMLLGDAKLDDFTRGMIGMSSHVLFEQEQDGYWEGYSSNYLKVRVRSQDNLKNEIRRVALHSMLGGKLIGEIISR
jgi:threonylcarbamoyladenosine tRNA methylthiotransferase MtaB